MRAAIVATAICLSIVGLSVAEDVKAAIRMPTNIPAQGLGPALKAFAEERDLPGHRTLDRGAVAAECMQAAVHHRLRGVDLAVSAQF